MIKQVAASRGTNGEKHGLRGLRFRSCQFRGGGFRGIWLWGLVLATAVGCRSTATFPESPAPSVVVTEGELTLTLPVKFREKLDWNLEKTPPNGAEYSFHVSYPDEGQVKMVQAGYLKRSGPTRTGSVGDLLSNFRIAHGTVVAAHELPRLRFIGGQCRYADGVIMVSTNDPEVLAVFREDRPPRVDVGVRILDLERSYPNLDVSYGSR